MVEPIFDYQFRLILIGDSTVGKSSLLKYFTDGRFAEVIHRVFRFHFIFSSCYLSFFLLFLVNSTPKFCFKSATKTMSFAYQKNEFSTSVFVFAYKKWQNEETILQKKEVKTVVGSCDVVTHKQCKPFINISVVPNKYIYKMYSIRRSVNLSRPN